MKKLLVFAALASALAVQEPALAQGGMFKMGAQCSFNQATGQCSVYNSMPMPIYCDIHITGQVMSGAWFKGFESVVVYPGQNAYGYVYAQNPNYDPLIGANGYAVCHT